MNTAFTMSDELFSSIYADMSALSVRQQQRIWNGLSMKKKKNYYVGECQLALNDFCTNKMTALEAMEFIKVQSAYNTPLGKVA